jgi:hypothetical protein
MATTRGLIALALLLAGCAAPREAPPAAMAAQGPALVMTAPRAVVLRPVEGLPGLWRAEDGVAVELRNGRVVATAGLGPILVATRFDTPDPLADPRALPGREVVARRGVDLAGADRDPAGMRFGVALTCTLRGREEAGWLLVEERCAGDGADFVNRFWAEPGTGRIRRSEQRAGSLPAVMVLEQR